jgi:hypothetical protein
MHTILALFDAPTPARGAVEALVAAGFAPTDIALACAVLESEPCASDRPRVLPTEPKSLAADLVGLDVPIEDAETCAEAVRRGAVLVAVTAPSVAAAAALSALDAFGVTDAAAQRARFAADPALRYDWARLPAPDLAAPPAGDVRPDAAGAGLAPPIPTS